MGQTNATQRFVVMGQTSATQRLFQPSTTQSVPGFPPPFNPENYMRVAEAHDQDPVNNPSPEAVWNLQPGSDFDVDPSS